MSGNYYVYLSAETVNNCPLETDSVLISVIPSPHADFSFTPSMFLLGETVTLTDASTGNIATWQWFNGDAYLSHEHEVAITPDAYDNLLIALIVQDENGCVDTTEKIIPINTEDLVYIPNAFTPNADGINDFFSPVDLLGVVAQMQIFNKWGALVWKSDGNSGSWDGTFRGEPAPEGVYVWNVLIRIGEINRKELTGHVSLLR